MESRGYHVLSRVGKGTYGTVWKVEKDGQVYAIKVVDLDYSRNLAELDILSRIDHPFIIPLHGFFIEDGKIYLIMKYVDGTLDGYLRSNPSPRDRVVTIYQVLSALYSLHRHGIYHCDLKPNNILMGGEGISYLADFGMARYEGDRISTCNPAIYQSIELLNNQNAISITISDNDIFCNRERYPPGTLRFKTCEIWSVGVLVNYIYTSRYIFGEEHDRFVDNIRRYEADPVTYLQERVPPELRDIMTGLLNISVECRTTDIRRVLRDPLFSNVGCNGPIPEITYRVGVVPTDGRTGMVAKLIEWSNDFMTRILQRTMKTTDRTADLIVRAFDGVARNMRTSYGLTLFASACGYIASGLHDEIGVDLGTILYYNRELKRDDLVDMVGRVVTTLDGILSSR